jgi:hypothetical protein
MLALFFHFLALSGEKKVKLNFKVILQLFVVPQIIRRIIRGPYNGNIHFPKYFFTLYSG